MVSRPILTAASALALAGVAMPVFGDNELQVSAILERHCLDCHDGDSQKGEVRLDGLETLALAERLALLNRAQEQVFLGEMPPKEKRQPTAAERESLLTWMSGSLAEHDASTLEDKLRYPNYGNHVDHERLFGGEIGDAPFSPARRWLVSPQIFDERVKDVFRIEGKERRRSLQGITNPLVLPERSGVRDYDNATLDGGHLLVMLPNAEWISTKQIHSARVKAGEIGANEFSDPKDKWVPRVAEPAFEAVILSSGEPSDEQLTAAIEAQFHLVLGRQPGGDELARYLDFTLQSIEAAGKSEGLRQMLVAVLLESEFLYRMEFGEGQEDEFGRRLLSPHEAARAVSYALGDRGPDEALRRAAEEGRLRTREDYRREVERLLADPAYYQGPVDPGISGKNMQSHETSHPRLVRFFREFFGYPAAAKIFKDKERSGGYYSNPDRGTMATPGFLIKEADRIVDLHLQRDRNVFVELLTTDEWFVYHNRGNEEGREIIREWTEVYDQLKDTNWKEDPEGVIARHEEYLASRKSVKIQGGHQKREFLRHMYFWGETIGKGRTPFTTPSFAHGYYYHHSVFYNLPPTPGAFRYGAIEQANFKGLDEVEFWDYPVEQPFRIAHRKGILTHPAWLIAHSSNFHTDPIKRGRWIREKLLAGRVPDVPITVDAQIPEDHHKTLRERVESVTSRSECWKCHQHMNPLGFPFEAFDDFGRYRLDEPLEHPEHLIAGASPESGTAAYQTRRVDTRGELAGTGDPRLDGEVGDAFDLIRRLADSERARQSIIRHAFRFFMGRNEMLSDAKTLIEADRAYVESGGSFKAVVVSLLSSDSFRYRKSTSIQG